MDPSMIVKKLLYFRKITFYVLFFSEFSYTIQIFIEHCRSPFIGGSKAS